MFEIKSFCFDVVMCDLVHVCLGHMNTVLMSSMMLPLTGVKSYFPNSFPLLQVKPFILPTVSLVAEKKKR